MHQTGFQKAEALIRKSRGMLRLSEAKRLGIPEPVIIRMLKAGILVREARGLYRLAELPPLANPDLITVSLLFPSAIVCLISALHFHDLTTQTPHKIYIAFPRGTKPPKLEYPPLETVWMSDKSYAAGIDIHPIDDVPVRIYCKEKTIADCFKFQRVVGRAVALEGLKDYLSQPSANIDLLLQYAKIDRVAKQILPYIRALI